MADEIQKLKNQQKKVLKVTEERIGLVKSFKDLKNELKALLWLNGYSKLLRTYNPFKKLFAIAWIIALVAGCLIFVRGNIYGFLEYGVVTEIKNQEQETLIFPAVTICLQTLNYTVDSDGYPNRRWMVSQNLSMVLKMCTFEQEPCSFEDFEYFQLFFAFFNANLNCYKFNSGKNASNHEIQLQQSTQFGGFSGLTLTLNLESKRQFIMYFVGDNKVRPIYTQLTKIAQPAKIMFVDIKKTVDIKLPEPHGRCVDDITSETSHLTKKIIEQDIAYTQKYCYDLCLNEYATKNDITQYSAYMQLLFNYSGNCSQYCPLECHQVTFAENKNHLDFDEGINNQLMVNFFYPENKYTEIRQSEKTTWADIVSNTGGVLGLFLELSFISAYRFISGLFGILF